MPFGSTPQQDNGPENFYFHLFEFAPVGYLVVSSSGKVKEVNQAAATLFDCPKDDLLGRPLDSFLKAEAQVLKGFWAEALSSGRTSHLETEALMADSSWKRIRLNGSSLVLPGASAPIILCAVMGTAGLGKERLETGRVDEKFPAASGLSAESPQDQTETPSSRGLLEDNETRFRRAFLEAPFPMMLHAENGQVLMTNNIWSEMTGFVPEEMRSVAQWTRLAFGQDRHYVLSVFEGLFKHDRRVEIGQFPVQTARGEVLVWDFSSAPSGHLSDGRRVHLTMAKDVTSWHQAEAALRDSEEKYRTLFETMAQGVVYHGPDGRIMSTNPAARSILGLPGPGKGQPASNIQDLRLIDEKGTPMTGDQFPTMNALKTGRPVSHRVLGVSEGLEGRQVWIKVNAVPQFQPETSLPFMAYATFEDVTALKQAQETLENRTSELNKRVQELTCLFHLARIIERYGSSLDKMLTEVVQALPSAYRFPDRACARILTESRTFQTDNFQETEWGQFENIFDEDQYLGRLEIFYPEPMPEADQGPFLKEEQELLRTVAERLGNVISRIRTQTALRENERLFRALFENAGDAIFLRNNQYRILDANDQACGLSGYSRTQLTQMRILDLMDPEFPEKCHIPQEKGARWRPGPVESILVDHSGRKIPVEVTVSRIFKEGQGGLLHVVRDITERKRTEEELRQSERRLKNILDSISAGLVIVDAGTRNILDVNRVSEVLLGRPREEIIGRSCAEFLCRSEHPLCERTPSLPVTGSSEEIILTGEGKKNHILKTVIPTELEGRPVFLETFLDITRNKNLENQLHQAQKMEAVGRLAGGLAHDFNNILTTIIGTCNLLLMEMTENDPARGDIQEIWSAGEKAVALTRQLLAFSRKQVMEPKVMDLNATIREIEKMLHRLIGEDIELKTLLAPRLDAIKVDPGKIEQVILNLAVNARDAMPEGGRLTLKTRCVDFGPELAADFPEISPGRFVEFSIKDTGLGMDEEVKAHIFEPFYTTKEVGKGTGLGLATVYGIIKQSQGFIYVESAPGQGTEFLIYFPSVNRRLLVDETEQVKDRPRIGEGTILLAEDEDMVRALVERLLTRLGYEIISAANGLLALEKASELMERIDLVITDVVMPEMNGVELIRRLRKMNPRVKVLFITGYADHDLLKDQDFFSDVTLLMKPFSPEDLARKVQGLLEPERARA